MRSMRENYGFKRGGENVVHENWLTYELRQSKKKPHLGTFFLETMGYGAFHRGCPDLAIVWGREIVNLNGTSAE